MNTTTYLIDGMTCGHCVASVTEEVSGVAGVSAVDVKLDGGVLTVTGNSIDNEAVQAAVAEAGYTLRRDS